MSPVDPIRRRKRRTAIAVVIIAICVAAIWTWNRSGPERRSMESRRPVTPAPSATVPESRGGADTLRVPANSVTRSQEPTVALQDAPSIEASAWTLYFVDENEAPLLGVEAAAELSLDEASIVLERSGAGAHWIIEAASWETAVIRAWAPGYVPARERFWIEPGGSGTLQLAPGGSIHGRVVDRTGEPVAQAGVALYKFEEDGDSSFLDNVYTDAAGRFRIGTITRGRVELHAHSESGSSEPLFFDLTHRAQVNAGTLVLLGSGEFIGHVTLPGGLPAPDVRIKAKFVTAFERGEAPPGFRERQTVTDTEGAFHLTGLAEGEYQLEHALVIPPSFRGQGRVRTGEGSVQLVLDATRLTVRAVDPEGGSATIHGYEVTDLDRGEMRIARSRGRSESPLTLYVNHGTHYRIRVTDFHNRTYEAEVLIPAGEAEREVVLGRLALEPAALRLTIRGPDGVPLTEFSAVLSRGNALGSTHLRAPGHLHDGVFPGLAPGSYSLEVNPAPQQFWESDLITTNCPATIELEPGRVTSVEANVVSGGRIELDLSEVSALFDHQGFPFSTRSADRPHDAFLPTLLFHREDQGWTQTGAPEVGLVWSTMNPLLPGRWMLRLEGTGYRRWEQVVVVRPGETTGVRVSLERE